MKRIKSLLFKTYLMFLQWYNRMVVSFTKLKCEWINHTFTGVNVVVSY
jgi:hypothetical protein